MPRKSKLMQVGPFYIEDKIAEGGMGAIYPGHFAAIPGQRIAMKVVSRFSSDQERRVLEQLLTNETEFLRDLRHPGVVRIYPVREHKGELKYWSRSKELDPKIMPFYFVMEQLMGGTLEDAMDQLSKAPLLTKLNLIYQMAVTLDYLHLREIAHYDLKPENVMLRFPLDNRLDNIRTVLIDFGIAGKAASINAATLAYASPERVVRLARSTETAARYNFDDTTVCPSDVWALGVMSYELLSGAYPFGRRAMTNTRALSCRILDNDIPPLPDNVPNEVQRIVMSMLTKSPYKRPTIEQIIQELDFVLLSTDAAKLTRS